MRALCCAALMALVGGCSSGRYYSHQDQMVVASMPAGQPVKGLAGCSATSAPPTTGQGGNTLFVHPGMLSLSAQWDRGLAVNGGQLLVREGYAGRIMELDGRDPERMVQAMMADPGQRFIGLHYSMGGGADLVARSVAATRQASLAAGRPMSYFPILVDPAGFGAAGDKLDMDSPYLGQLFVLVSEEGATLRPDIESVSRRVLDHPKTHLLYAEDFGLEWSHFGALTDLTAARPNARQRRSHELFAAIAAGINAGTTASVLEARFDALKVAYAQADHRPIMAAWLHPGGTGPCSSPVLTTAVPRR